MGEIDPVARAIDWLDACKANDWRSVSALYADDASISIPSSLRSGPALRLERMDQIRHHWMSVFQGPTEVFELVEIYPGCDSVVLVYYDRHCRRICEYLQFNETGLISNAARHVIPQRRHPAPRIDSASRTSGTTCRALLRCEARQNLEEARQLPVGSARNGLRQRAVALKALAEREACCVGL